MTKITKETSNISIATLRVTLNQSREKKNREKQNSTSSNLSDYKKKDKNIKNILKICAFYYAEYICIGILVPCLNNFLLEDKHLSVGSYNEVGLGFSPQTRFYVVVCFYNVDKIR